MNYEIWENKNWWIVRTGSGGADMNVDDQFHVDFDPFRPQEVKIDNFFCPHGGIHGTHWNGAICCEIPATPHDQVQGQTISSLPFRVTSTKPGALEQLHFALQVEIPTPEVPPGGPAGASWTAEEGGTGRPGSGIEEPPDVP